MEYALSLLPLLACPLVMGLMMWLMMRMNQGESTGPARTPQATVRDMAPGDRLSQLRGRLGELQTRQAELAGHIERLAAEEQATEPRPQSLPTVQPALADADPR